MSFEVVNLKLLMAYMSVSSHRLTQHNNAIVFQFKLTCHVQSLYKTITLQFKKCSSVHGTRHRA